MALFVEEIVGIATLFVGIPSAIMIICNLVVLNYSLGAACDRRTALDSQSHTFSVVCLLLVQFTKRANKARLRHSRKKTEAKSKGRRGKSSLEMELMKNSEYSTDSSNEFPTIEEWVASKDNFRVVGLGYERPFPLVHHISCNASLVDYHRENVAPHLGRVLSNHKIP